jgi:hypothetical protein
MTNTPKDPKADPRTKTKEAKPGITESQKPKTGPPPSKPRPAPPPPAGK